MVKNIRCGNAKITVKDKQYTLSKLFSLIENSDTQFLSREKGWSGAEIYSFTETDHKIAIKYIKPPGVRSNVNELIFLEWLSAKAVEPGICRFFPLFIDKRVSSDEKGVIFGMEYLDYKSFYPDYLCAYILTTSEFNLITEKERMDYNYIRPKNCEPIEESLRILTLKTIVLEIIYAIYILTSVNGHFFRHIDLHINNVFLRPTATQNALPYFGESEMREVLLPEIGVEAVIGDFGESIYPGYEPLFHSKLTKSHLINPTEDLRKFNLSFRLILERFGWEKLMSEFHSLTQCFDNNPESFPTFESILATEFFRGIFQTRPSTVLPQNLYIEPPFPVCRYNNLDNSLCQHFLKSVKSVENLSVGKNTDQIMKYIVIVRPPRELTHKISSEILQNVNKMTARDLLEKMTLYVETNLFISFLYNNSDGLKTILNANSSLSKYIELFDGLSINDLKGLTDDQIMAKFMSIPRHLAFIVLFNIKNSR